MKNTAAKATTVHSTTPGFQNRPLGDERPFLTLAPTFFMLLDLVDIAATATGGLTPSLPNTGSSVGSRTDFS